MSSARLGDLERRVANMLRPGKILEADYEKARVRVAIGKNKTAWLPWVTARAAGDRTWHPPEVGEQVLVMAPSGNLGAGFIVPGGVYQEDAPANGDSADVSRVTYKDGTVIEYDRANHAHLIQLPEGSATVKVGEDAETEITREKITHRIGDGSKVEIESDKVTLSAGGCSIEVSGDGIKITGAVEQTGGNLTSDGIGLQTHRHGGVETGSGETDEPTDSA